MDPASLEFITLETIPAAVETQVVFPVRLILVGIRKEKTMNPADRNLGIDSETIPAVVATQLVYPARLILPLSPAKHL